MMTQLCVNVCRGSEKKQASDSDLTDVCVRVHEESSTLHFHISVFSFSFWRFHVSVARSLYHRARP